jgi:hypothetical protein
MEQRRELPGHTVHCACALELLLECRHVFDVRVVQLRPERFAVEQEPEEVPESPVINTLEQCVAMDRRLLPRRGVRQRFACESK